MIITTAAALTAAHITALKVAGVVAGSVTGYAIGKQISKNLPREIEISPSGIKTRHQRSTDNVKIMKSNLGVSAHNEDYATVIYSEKDPVILINDAFDSLTEETKKFIIEHENARIFVENNPECNNDDMDMIELICDDMAQRALGITNEQRFECLKEMWFETRPISFEPTGTMKDRMDYCKYKSTSENASSSVNR